MSKDLGRKLRIGVAWGMAVGLALGFVSRGDVSTSNLALIVGTVVGLVLMDIGPEALLAYAIAYPMAFSLASQTYMALYVGICWALLSGFLYAVVHIVATLIQKWAH